MYVVNHQLCNLLMRHFKKMKATGPDNLWAFILKHLLGSSESQTSVLPRIFVIYIYKEFILVHNSHNKHSERNKLIL